MNIKEKYRYLQIVIKYHFLGLKIVAEGVENQNQVKLLKLMGCDILQGFFFSKPLETEKVGSYFIDAVSSLKYEKYA